MRVSFVITFVLAFFCAGCDLGHVPEERTPATSPGHAVVTGTVTSAGAYPFRPITNATVTLIRDTMYSTTQSDTSGRFRFAGLSPGLYRLSATRVGYDTVSRDILLSSLDSGAVDVSLARLSGFLPGNVLIGLRDTTQLRTVVEYCASTNHTLKSISLFEYATEILSADSVGKIKTIVGAKPYVHGNVVITSESRALLWVFDNFNLSALNDWEATARQLGFHEVPGGSGRWGVLQVPFGTECASIRTLSAVPMFALLSLDLIYTIQRPPADFKRRGYRGLHPLD